MPDMLDYVQCPVCRRPGLMKTGSRPDTFVCTKCQNSIPTADVITAIQEYLDELKLAEEHRPNLDLDTASLLGPYIDEDDRKLMYSKVVYLGCFSFLAFYIFLCLLFPMDTLPWVSLIVALIVSRLADMTTTLIGLAFGMMETNPLSDRWNISRLIKPQVIQVIACVGASFVLGLISPWLRNGLLMIYTLMGFTVAIANLAQLIMDGRYRPDEDPAAVMSRIMIKANTIAIIIVAVISLILFCIIF